MEDPPPATTQHGFVQIGEGVTPSTEEGADLQVFTPARAHLLLQEVYLNFPHHNNKTNLSELVPDDATWKFCWRRLAAQSAIWFSSRSGKVGHPFTAVLDVD